MAKRDVAIYIRAIDKASKVMTGISRAGDRAFRGLAVAATSASVAIAGVTAAYAGLVNQGVRYNEAMETYENTLTTVFKSQAKALQQLEWAKKTAAGTPFQLPGIVEATVKLEAYGLKAKDVLTTTGDMAAVMGKPLMQAIEAVADAQTGELERLKEFGITKGMLIEKGLAVAATGQIQDFQSLNDALFTIMEERFAGGMATMMDSFKGMASNLQDWWGIVTGALAKPVFEQLKIEMRSVLDWLDRLKTTGRLDRVLKDWGEAGAIAIKRISDLLKIIGPRMLDAIERSGRAVRQFMESISQEQVKAAAQRMVDLATAFYHAAEAVGKFLLQYKELIVAFAAAVIISKVTLKLIALGHAVKAVAISAKVAALALSAAFGPAGAIALAVGVLAVVTAGVISYYKSASKAAEATRKWREEHVKMQAQRLTQDLDTNREKIEAITKAIKQQQRIMHQAYKEINADQGLSPQWQPVSEEERERLLNLYKIAGGAADKVRLLKRELGALRQAAPERVAPFEEIMPSEDAYEKVNAARLKAEQRLNDMVAELAMSEYEHRKYQIAKQVDEFREAKIEEEAIARYQVAALSALENDRTVKLKEEAAKRVKIAKEEQQAIASAYDSAMGAIIQLQGNETQAAEYNARMRAKQIQEQTGDAVLAGKYLEMEMAKIQTGITDKQQQEALARIRVERELAVKTLESQGNIRQAALMRLDDEVNALREAKVAEGAIEEFYAARKAQINRDADEKIRKENEKTAKAAEKVDDARLKMLDQMELELAAARQGRFEQELARIEQKKAKYMEAGVAEFQAEQWASAQIVALKQAETDRIYNMERRRLREIGDTYADNMSKAMELGRLFFSMEEQGWMRTLAGLIRFTAKIVASYLQQQALEKLKQAMEAKTEAKWQRHHAERMAALAAEAAASALMALAMGDYAKAAGFGLAAKDYGIAAGASLAAAGVLEAEAKSLETQAAALTIAAVATETAGEVAATALERAADRSDALRRDEERRLQEEKRLQEEILQMQGRDEDAGRIQLQQEVAQMREQGLAGGLVSEWERLKMQEIAAGTGTRATAPAMAASGGGGTVIYQTNSFSGFMDSASENDLREMAHKLAPYNEEVQGTYTESD